MKPSLSTEASLSSELPSLSGFLGRDASEWAGPSGLRAMPQRSFADEDFGEILFSHRGACLETGTSTIVMSSQYEAPHCFSQESCERFKRTCNAWCGFCS